ncbi:MAG: DUF4431 domain-containing protein [Deltaproteobacteria bacterium]|nr:DUF4431 domain-containing protein [Deltaproteobacteria bacterium]
MKYSTVVIRLVALSGFISAWPVDLASAHQSSPRQALAYEPAEVELTGTIETQTFPGPPNWESVANGDEIERGWYLRLDRQIDVGPRLDSNTANTESEKNVRILQIAVGNDSIWKELRDGRRCKLKGTLFHRLTGHHHSRVLIHADSFVAVIRRT